MNGILHVRLDKPVQGAEMSEFNSLGQVMAKPEVAGSSISIPVTGWAAGQYFVRLLADGQVLHRKFVIR